jgi:molybdopterin-containing oxidoreductase family iron-sulfur binding subunit
MSPVQPLIAPLWDAVSDVAVAAALAGQRGPTDYEQVLATWTPRLGASPDATWRRWLHDGVGATGLAPAAAPAFAFGGLAERLAAAPAPSDGLEVVHALSATVYDGRWANNAWLQELPDPMTKLTWGNAVCMSPRTAQRLGIDSGDRVEVGQGGRTVTGPAWVTPGLADDTLLLPAGYGRTAAGRKGDGVGFNAAVLRSAASPWFAGGATIKAVGGREEMATTQDHGTLVEPITSTERRDIVRQGSLAQYRANPGFVRELDVMPAEKLRSLWVEPNVTGGHQWGMSIDLTSCIGCNACTVACQAENNIPVVGKKEVLNGREMHWIRLDRYYSGDPDDPQAVHQPLPCMQCENAPCESVCPVAATTHSPEGLNDMAYNRCIGTRYCSNNCPYKVRRFNFFAFQKRMDGEIPLIAAQRNQNVTVRFRGVMEKCTYCVQRINEARSAAKVGGDGRIADGGVVTACQQACPADAIVFGDVADPRSRVSRLKAQPRDYGLLAELNTQPRTTYLARLRNPNPALAPASHAAASDEAAH